VSSQARLADETAIDYVVRKAVSVFNHYDEREDAIENLRLAGFECNRIRLLACHKEAEEKAMVWVEVRNAAEEEKALEVLRRHSGADVCVHKLTRTWGAARLRSLNGGPRGFESGA
jgi:hypothetical protein